MIMQNYETLSTYELENGYYFKHKVVDGVHKIMLYHGNRNRTVVSLMLCRSFDTAEQATDFLKSLLFLCGETV